MTFIMNDQFKVIRREGKILERFDWQNDKVCASKLYIEWNGCEYSATMLNGELTKLTEHSLGYTRKLWKV